MRCALAKSIGVTTIHDLNSFYNYELENVSFSKVDNDDLDKSVWTTKTELKLEADNIKIWQECQGEKTPFKSQALLSRMLHNIQRSTPDFQLTSGQMSALEHIMRSKDRIIGIQGYAGTGKTRMLGVTTELLGCMKKIPRAFQNINVIGCAVTGSAANQLKEKANIPSSTIEKYLLTANKKISRKQTLLIVDEASMISSKDMNRLLKIAKKDKNLSIVMLGDQAQLSSVNAGKPFQQLISNGMSFISMEEIVRQNNPKIKQAVEKTIQGKLFEASELIKENVFEFTDKEERLRKISEKYLQFSDKERDSALVIVGTHFEREFINHYVRQRLIDTKKIGEQNINMAVLCPIRIGNERLNDLINYKKGMIIRLNNKLSQFANRGDYCFIEAVDKDKELITLRNNTKELTFGFKSLQPLKKELYKIENREFRVGEKLLLNRSIAGIHELKNNTEVTVTGIKNKKLIVECGNGSKKKSYELDTTQNKNMHLDYAYSRTLFASQGDDKSNVILSLDSTQAHATNYRGFYVGVSRAVDNLYLYVDDFKKTINNICIHTGEKDSALEAVNNEKSVIIEKQEKVFVDKPGVKAQEQYLLFDPKPAIEQQQFPEKNSPSVYDIYDEYVMNSIQSESPAPQNIQQPARNNDNSSYIKYDTEELNSMLNSDTISQVAMDCIGDANTKLSTKNNLRFGKKGSLSLSLEDNSFGLWKDFETDESGNIYQLVESKMGVSFPESVKHISGYVGYKGSTKSVKKIPKKAKKDKGELSDQDKKSMLKAQKIYDKCRPVEGTLAQKYLTKFRKIAGVKYVKDVKFHPGLYEPQTKKFLPAMVCGAKREGKIEAVQAIYLDPKTGAKYPGLDVAKRTTGRLKYGASVQLSSGSKQVICVCEGPETALSVRHSFPNYTVISSLSVSNMAKIQYPKGHKIIICQDNDGVNAPSEKAYEKIKTQLKEKGFDVVMVKPKDTFIDGKFIKTDFNDVLNTGGKEAVQEQIQAQLSAEKMGGLSQVTVLSKSPELAKTGRV
jgi:ATP-dependent exoDNAse (exonuclease V) alpha subunit